MKRIVAFSDSHGAQEALERCVRHALTGIKPYAAVFLGDGERDFERLHPLLYRCGVHAYQVAGNNDFGSSCEKEFVIQLDGVSVYACHGHTRQVYYTLNSLLYAAREHGAQAALYGHTHVPSVEWQDGVVLLNPGSVRDCTGNRVCYAELVVDEKGLHPAIIDTVFDLLY